MPEAWPEPIREHVWGENRGNTSRNNTGESYIWFDFSITKIECDTDSENLKEWEEMLRRRAIRVIDLHKTPRRNEDSPYSPYC